MSTYSLSGSEVNGSMGMKRNQSIVAATFATVALVAVFTLSGAGVANATPPNSGTTATPTQSCWIDASTQESLCVPTGEDLVAAVQAEDGVSISVPAGTGVSGVEITQAHLDAAQLSTASASSEIAVSILYDDINYGGGSVVLTSNTGCDAGLSSLVPYGWNDRASSFKSYNGCLTALYQNINYSGTRVGYSSSKASFGSQNDQGSSWETE
jgi:hypothetical protein